MAQDEKEITVATTGDIWSYATSETAPTAIGSALPVTAVSRGFITEDGFSIDDSVSWNDIKAWQRSALVRRISTDASVELTLATLQLNDENITWFTGQTKQADGSWEFDPAQTGGRLSYDLWAFDMVNETLTRIYIPEGEITDREAMQFTSTDATTLGVTVTAYFNATKGYTYKIWHGAIPAGS